MYNVSICTLCSPNGTYRREQEVIWCEIWEGEIYIAQRNNEQFVTSISQWRDTAFDRHEKLPRCTSTRERKGERTELVLCYININKIQVLPPITEKRGNRIKGYTLYTKMDNGQQKDEKQIWEKNDLASRRMWKMWKPIYVWAYKTLDLENCLWVVFERITVKFTDKGIQKYKYSN